MDFAFDFSLRELIHRFLIVNKRSNVLKSFDVILIVYDSMPISRESCFLIQDEGI